MTTLEHENRHGRTDRLGLLNVVVGVERRRILKELATRNDRSLSAEIRRAIDLYAQKQEIEPFGR